MLGTDAFPKVQHPRLILTDWSFLWELVAEGGELQSGEVLEVKETLEITSSDFLL